MLSRLPAICLFSLFLGASAAQAQSVLISGFDPFDNAKDNNSRRIGKLLVQKLSAARPDLEISYCQLRTVYDKSVDTLLDCVRSLKEPPKFVLSLGEAGCGEARIETLARNIDLDYSSDNDGVHRNGQTIFPEGPKAVGIRLPLSQAWCQLPASDKRFLRPSNDAGTFVCNHLSYHMSYAFPEVPFGFAHVPSHNCFFGSRSFNKALNALENLVLAMLAIDKVELAPYPQSKSEVSNLAKQGDACEQEFYNRLLSYWR